MMVQMAKAAKCDSPSASKKPQPKVINTLHTKAMTMPSIRMRLCISSVRYS